MLISVFSWAAIVCGFLFLDRRKISAFFTRHTFALLLLLLLSAYSSSSSCFSRTHTKQHTRSFRIVIVIVFSFVSGMAQKKEHTRLCGTKGGRRLKVGGGFWPDFRSVSVLNVVPSVIYCSCNLANYDGFNVCYRLSLVAISI